MSPMININNREDINWTKTKIGILGGGKSGIAAAKLGIYIGAKIFISDSNNTSETIEKMHEFDYESDDFDPEHDCHDFFTPL